MRTIGINENLELMSDLAGEKPIYVYIGRTNNEIYYSNNERKLLSFLKEKKLLKISKRSMSFLLQNGVIPIPYTIYKDLYILGIGIKMIVKNSEIKFEKKFPFYNENRQKGLQFNKNKILEDIASATIQRIDINKPIFLFHSAGKDSNMIALALSEYKGDLKKNIICISHKSKGSRDESEISKEIAKKLGFKHIILKEKEILGNFEKEKIIEYFTNISFPNVDNVALAYPLYTLQVPELYGANIIDGGGNDSYMCTPPNSRELKMYPLSIYLHKLSFLRKQVASENILNTLLKTPLEWFAMWGLSYKDTKNIVGGYEYNCSEFWLKEWNKKKTLDLFDLKTDIYSSNVISTVHIGKVRNFVDMIDGNLVLPFADENIAKYYMKMPEKYLFDRTRYKNKIIFRHILKESIGLDSDKIGKKGYSFDSRSVILNNIDFVLDEILSCKYWDKQQINQLIKRLSQNMKLNKRIGYVSGNMLYRLFLISGWINHNRFLK